MQEQIGESQIKKQTNKKTMELGGNFLKNLLVIKKFPQATSSAGALSYKSRKWIGTTNILGSSPEPGAPAGPPIRW